MEDTEAKILNKIFANIIQEHIKKIMMVSFQTYRDVQHN